MQRQQTAFLGLMQRRVQPESYWGEQRKKAKSIIQTTERKTWVRETEPKTQGWELAPNVAVVQRVSCRQDINSIFCSSVKSVGGGAMMWHVGWTLVTVTTEETATSPLPQIHLLIHAGSQLQRTDASVFCVTSLESCRWCWSKPDNGVRLKEADGHGLIPVRSLVLMHS